MAYRYLNCPIGAQDVVQDVFLKLWINRKTIQETLPVEGWLFSVGRNNVLNRYKKQSNEVKALSQLKLSQVVTDHSVQHNFEQSEFRLLHEKAVSRLSEKQATVYRMAKDDDLTYNQIAECLNISPLTVKTHMSRALSNLRDSLRNIN